METYFHSVMLDREKCKGCTTCIKHCPTEAIRVRNGKALIIKERCIDCGQCIRVCPHRAKKAVCDSFKRLADYKYNVALPAPSLYGQFNNLDDIGLVLTALLKIGFDDVFEVAKAAEIISVMTGNFMKDRSRLKKSVISSACPACVRLIKKRFPQLVGNVIPHAAPVDLAGMMARKQAVEKTGFLPSEIGIFFITPCPAKMTEIISPVGLAKSPVDGAFSMAEVYVKLVGVMKEIKEPVIQPSSGLVGIGWSLSGGESAALLNEKYLAVDGIENVIKVLEDIEDDKLREAEFIEINACTQGCVGGCLTVENPYVAKTRIQRLMKHLPVSGSEADIDGIDEGLSWERELEYAPVWKLDENMHTALAKMQEINRLLEELPGLDCGSCGAPSCRAFAEDVVLGHARGDDCIFNMREKMQDMAGEVDADAYLPPPFRRNKEESNP